VSKVLDVFHSGSLETTKVLLESGADKAAQNSINKTAAQLGAFTGGDLDVVLCTIHWTKIYTFLQAIFCPYFRST
jgi:hypothetical protein